MEIFIETYLNIKAIAGGKISPHHIKEGYSSVYKKYENLIKLDSRKFIRRTRA